jgi:hypothetical protein
MINPFELQHSVPSFPVVKCDIKPGGFGSVICEVAWAPGARVDDDRGDILGYTDHERAAASYGEEGCACQPPDLGDYPTIYCTDLPMPPSANNVCTRAIQASHLTGRRSCTAQGRRARSRGLY